ncbi:type III effector protein [Streptomyces sp. NBC_01483]|uniref:type III effector protein n=1 Tax=Streptomyces sp. NBC_01483 TaxID=2903883 RepID=UPI002E300098|nr:type III effector protein [Streptomyces sp. NBC_01483]
MNASPEPRDPTSFFAAAAALNTINEAVRIAQTPQTGVHPQDGQASADQALTALLLLRELRDQLAGWEPGLIEAARAAGSSWADLAHPLGVASRQAAERRYLRVRPGTPGTTGEQRVQATRDRRAADRTITAWARTNAADLRQLAGQITALTDLPAQARTPLARLADALADNDAANLIAPLVDTHTHLKANHPDLATRIDTISRHADRLRQAGSDHR